jgi:hypothetical protein
MHYLTLKIFFSKSSEKMTNIGTRKNPELQKKYDTMGIISQSRSIEWCNLFVWE